jgi:hypothetical protein
MASKLTFEKPANNIVPKNDLGPKLNKAARSERADIRKIKGKLQRK